jgi:hypothetical protein
MFQNLRYCGDGRWSEVQKEEKSVVVNNVEFSGFCKATLEESNSVQ